MSKVRSVLEIPIFHKIYELNKWLDSHHSRIPKAKRYTLWQKCDNTALNLLELLIETGGSEESARQNLLHQMSYKLDLLKVLMRLAKETRIITIEQYVEVESLLHEIGKMLGGWLKFVSN